MRRFPWNFAMAAFLSMMGAMATPVLARDNLDLVVMNGNAKTTLVVSVLGSSSGKTENPGRVAPGQSTHYSLPVADGSTISVVASLISGPDVDKQTFTVRGETTKTVTVDVGQAMLVPDTAADTLVNAITQFHYTGLPTRDRDSAITQYLGAVVFYDITKDKGTAVIDAVSPTIIGDAVTKDQVGVGQDTYHATQTYTTTMNAKVSASIPAFVALGFGASSNTLYQVDYLLTQAGSMSATAAKSTSAATAFAAVPLADVKLVCGLHPTEGHVIYIDQLFGVMGGSLSTKATQATTKTGTVGGNLFVVGDTAFDDSKSTAQITTITPTVIGYEGADLPLEQFCQAYKPKSELVNVSASAIQGAVQKSAPSLAKTSRSDLDSALSKVTTLQVPRTITTLEQFQRLGTVRKAPPPAALAALDVKK